MDDKGIHQSIGQQFMTTDGYQCFCGNGGNISCDPPNHNSISNGKLNLFKNTFGVKKCGQVK